MKKKLVIFDMGNTLLNFHKGIHTDEQKDVIGISNIKKLLEEEYNITTETSTIRKELIDKWYGDFYKRDLLIELDFNCYLKSFLEYIGKSDISIDSYKIMKSFYKAYMEEVLVTEGVHTVLKTLSKDYYIGVISNCILLDDIYIEVFEKQGLRDYIDKFVFSYSRKIRKPDKRLFYEMIEEFNIETQNIYMIGDSLKADIKPAKEIGISTIWFTSDQDNNEYADHRVIKMENILDIVGLA